MSSRSRQVRRSKAEVPVLGAQFEALGLDLEEIGSHIDAEEVLTTWLSTPADTEYGFLYVVRWVLTEQNPPRHVTNVLKVGIVTAEDRTVQKRIAEPWLHHWNRGDFHEASLYCLAILRLPQGWVTKFEKRVKNDVVVLYKKRGLTQPRPSGWAGAQELFRGEDASLVLTTCSQLLR